MTVVDRAPNAVEIGEQQVAVDETIDSIMPYGLLERPQGVARRGKQLAPSPSPHHRDSRTRAISLRTHGEVDGRMRPPRGGNGEDLSYRVTSGVCADVRIRSWSDRHGREPRQRSALEEDYGVGCRRDDVRIIGSSRRSHPDLPMSEGSLEGDLDVRS